MSAMLTQISRQVSRARLEPVSADRSPALAMIGQHLFFFRLLLLTVLPGWEEFVSRFSLFYLFC